jgi:hypothetical protein
VTIKTFSSAETKVGDQGHVSAVIATIGVVDKDGDVMVDGCLPETKVAISPFGHALWSNGPGITPLGYGTFKQSGDLLVFDGTYNLKIQAARDAFEDLKMALAEGVNTEWSFSLENIVGEQVKVGGVTARAIKSFSPREVSRVLVGASIGSGTLAVKGVKQLASSIRRLLHDAAQARWPGLYPYVEDFDPDAGTAVFEVYRDSTYTLVQVDFTRTDTSVVLGPDESEVHRTATFLPKAAKFSEHAEAVLAAVDGLAARAAEVVALRAEKGKSISDESAGLLKQLTDRLDAVKALVDQPATPNPADAVARTVLAGIARRHGVTQ